MKKLSTVSPFNARSVLRALAIILLLAYVYLWVPREKFNLAPGVGKRVVMYHYTDWCPACKAMRPVYESVKAALAPTGITFYENDEAKKPTQGVTGYPTITVIDELGKRHSKTGVTGYDDLVLFITTPKYYVS